MNFIKIQLKKRIENSKPINDKKIFIEIKMSSGTTIMR